MHSATPDVDAEIGGASDAAGRSGAFITPGYRIGFALVTSLFFLWAIANNFNDILIRHFQKALDLDRAQAGFIQFVFYLGYFVMALPAGLLMRRFGYKAGIIAGLALYATGALMFYPAAEARVYAGFLAALFVLAAGAAFLETAANPYIVAFGDPARASQRLNLAQAFNGFGGFLAPILGGMFIFSGVEHSAATVAGMSAATLEAYRLSEARTVQTPYLVLAAVVVVLAIAIAATRLPRVVAAGGEQGARVGIRALLRVPALRGAVIAQFFYVGAQVGIWSFFVDFVKDHRPETPERTAAYLLSASLVLFMVGRFVGVALLQHARASTLLAAYAVANIALTAVAVVAPGDVAIAALMLTGFFMSIMFPTIFALGVKDLGAAATLGSSLIVMAIIGGAVFPPAMGLVSHHVGGLRVAMVAPLLCFAVVFLYARRAGRA